MLRFLLIVSITLLVSACGGGSSSSSSSNTEVIKIVAIGDSIGAGFGPTTPWPDLLAGKVGVPVINNSVAGRVAADGAAVIDGLLAAHQPSHVVVLLGSNDARDKNGADAASAMAYIVNACVQAGVVPIVGTLPPNFQSDPEFDVIADQISAGYRALPGAVIANIRGALQGRSEFFFDGLHPDNNGQEIIASKFAEAL